MCPGLAELEDRLSRLSARIAAAGCELLLLLDEFDARQGWGECGIKSAAHWLSWYRHAPRRRTGEGARRPRAAAPAPCARRVRRGPPLLLQGAGTEPGRDGADGGRARRDHPGCTGAQLERILRAWRTCLVAETSASNHVRRGLSRREEDDGSVVFTPRVAPEEAAVVDQAIAAARAVVLDDQQPVETPEETSLAALLTDDPPAVRAEAEADAVVLMAGRSSRTASRDSPTTATSCSSTPTSTRWWPPWNVAMTFPRNRHRARPTSCCWPGHRQTDVPYPEMDPALRAAAGWPEQRKPPPWQVAPAA